jgi:membrane protease YdiL (CAAX protease family)
LLSPVAVIALGNAVQHVAGRTLGAWAWLPTMLAFWAATAGVIVWARRDNPPKNWFAPPGGGVVWSALAAGVGLLSAREFAAGWRVLDSPAFFVLWLAFGLVNPWFEECYWRGLLIDAARWKGVGVIGSTIVFVLSHPLIWGVHSPALRHPAALAGLGLVGAVWGVTYWRTGSLRWTIVGHSCANLLGLSVPVLLNVHVPAGLG